MKKTILFILLISSLPLLSQEKVYKLGTFGIVQADLGLDLTMLLSRRDENSLYDSRRNDEPTYFNYGFQAQAGYNPFHWFGFSGGVRYTYITDKYHNLYTTGQLYFFTSDKDDEDRKYLSLYFGKQFNNTQGYKNGGFIGLGIGGIQLVNEHIGQKLQIHIEGHSAGEEFPWFIGFSYGIVFHSRKFE